MMKRGLAAVLGATIVIALAWLGVSRSLGAHPWWAPSDVALYGAIPGILLALGLSRLATGGIYVGGGASVRVGRILGADRMVEMMLTGRKYGAEEGQALGLAHYSVGEGGPLPIARKLASQIASNAPLSNYIMIQAIARIEDMSKTDGLFTESLCAAITQTSPDAIEGLQAFLQKRDPSFR